MKEALLSLENISFKFNTAEKPLIEDLSLVIRKNSSAAVIGPNGAGKTTFLNIALGWYKPFAGEVKFNGKELGSFTRRQSGQHIALVPQNEHIPFEYTLLEYVLLGRTPYISILSMPKEIDYEVSLQALDSVNLDRNRIITTLSGGELQLLLIARALAQQPQLLLLDEPTSHLDIKNKIRVHTLLKKLIDSGITLLFTTHDPAEAAEIASHIIMMKNGNVETEGNAADVLTDRNLSSIYGVKIGITEANGKKVIFW